eukprot:2706807-Rhodomonas_salina.2
MANLVGVPKKQNKKQNHCVLVIALNVTLLDTACWHGDAWPWSSKLEGHHHVQTFALTRRGQWRGTQGRT